jgi:hypothetical protein
MILEPITQAKGKKEPSASATIRRANGGVSGSVFMLLIFNPP